MTKHRMLAALLSGLILMSLAGCAANSKTAESAENTHSQATVSSDEASDRTLSDNSSAETEPAKDTANSEPAKEQMAEKEKQPVSKAAAASDNPAGESITPPADKQPVQAEPPKTDEPSPANPSVSPTPPESPNPRPDASAVEAKTAQYINQYRRAQGVSAMAVLPGLTEVAHYRANQLITDFSHESTPDAATVLKYGEYVDMGKYGYPEDSYYRGYSREAIAKGNWSGTADEIAQKIAAGFKNSANHWSYLGNGEYRYIAVGCVYDTLTQKWYCCVCVSAEDYGG